LGESGRSSLGEAEKKGTGKHCARFFYQTGRKKERNKRGDIAKQGKRKGKLAAGHEIVRKKKSRLLSRGEGDERGASIWVILLQKEGGGRNCFG